MRRRREVDSELGVVEVDTLVCNYCGHEEPESRAINWLRIEVVGTEAIAAGDAFLGEVMTSGLEFCNRLHLEGYIALGRQDPPNEVRTAPVTPM